MRARILTLTIVLLQVMLPWTSYAGIITVEEVSVQIKPAAGGAFQLLFNFELPQLPAKVNIDYAVLSFGVNIAGAPNGRALEILSGNTPTQGKTGDYNRNPVKGWLPKNKTGLVEIHLDVTQLVDLWVNGGEKNQGVSLVSHRRISEKALDSDKIDLALDYKKATVRIFYTKI